MVWHDLNGDGYHDSFVTLDHKNQDPTDDNPQPDVVIVVDESGSTIGSPGFDDFGFVGTAGTAEVTTSGRDDWHTVSLSGKTFLDPVVIASPVSYNDTDPAVARIANVQASYQSLSFDLQVDEWEYLEDQAHATETVNYLVVEAGHHMLDDRTVLPVGTVLPDGTVLEEEMILDDGTIIEAGTVQVDSDGDVGLLHGHIRCRRRHLRRDAGHSDTGHVKQ